jgi:hypothetical protein
MSNSLWPHRRLQALCWAPCACCSSSGTSLCCDRCVTASGDSPGWWALA